MKNLVRDHPSDPEGNELPCSLLSRPVKLVETYSLVPAPDSPRKHPHKKIKLLARNIRKFSIVIPLIIDVDNRIVCGHARFEAAKRIGLNTLPCIVVDDLSDAEIRAYRIADNRLAELAEWNEKQLAEEFKILSNLNLDFSLDLTGFLAPERESLITKFREVPEGSDGADVIGKFEHVPAVCMPGDLWHVGSHCLLYGDATSAASYEHLLGSDCSDMVIADPPYNISARHIGKVCAEQHGDFAVAAGEMSPVDYQRFLETIFEHACRSSRDGSIHYFFQGWRHMGEMLAAGLKHYTEQKNLCIWVKDTPGMGTFYRSQHELVFVFKNGTEKHRNNFELGQYGRSRSNIWRYPSVQQFSEFDGNPSGREALSLHPTIKPVQLLMDAILDCSLRGESILDPFLGSGSTLIACERTHRRCFGIELEPRYLDVAIDRWQSWTGEQAIHVDSGESFNTRSNRTTPPIDSADAGEASDG